MSQTVRQTEHQAATLNQFRKHTQMCGERTRVVLQCPTPPAIAIFETTQILAAASSFAPTKIGA